jgi:hypothetical protein
VARTGACRRGLDASGVVANELVDAPWIFDPKELRRGRQRRNPHVESARSTVIPERWGFFKTDGASAIPVFRKRQHRQTMQVMRGESAILLEDHHALVGNCVGDAAPDQCIVDESTEGKVDPERNEEGEKRIDLSIAINACGEAGEEIDHETEPGEAEWHQESVSAMKREALFRLTGPKHTLASEEIGLKQ